MTCTRPAAAAALAAAAAFAFGAPAARAQTARDNSDQMERPEVREVRIRGAKALDAGDVADALATKASGCLSLAFAPFCLFTKSPYVYERRYLDRDEFERDVVRLLVFYYKRGYRDTQVDTAVTRAGRNAVRVTFTVREGPPTRTGTLAVDDPTGTLPAREAERLLAPKPGDPFNTLRLDSAVVRVRDFYYDRGYGNAVVERPAVAVDDSADTASARIPVRRGPLTPISRIDIVRTGAQREVRDESIRNALTVAPGDLFRRSEVARSQRALYETGLFRSALIDTAVATQGGNGETVCASQGTLATARPATAAAGAAPDSTKALVVCVAEAPLREVRTSAGFTTADFVQVEGRFTHNYFLGGSRRFNAQATVGNLGSRQLSRALPQSFNNPFRNTNIPGRREDRFFLPTYQLGFDLQQRDLGSPRNTLGFGVFASRRSSPGVFVDQGQGANLAFTRRVGARTPVSLTYQFELNRVQAGDVYFCVNFGVCDAPTIAAVSSARRLAPLALTASTGQVDDPLSPSRGLLGRVSVQHASQATFSQFRYNRAEAEVSYYRPAPGLPRVTLATRLRGGFVRAIGGATGTGAGVGGTQFELLHPRTRFYAGGAQSVRGYGENQLGPRVLTIAPGDILAVSASDTARFLADPRFDVCRGGARDLRACFGARNTIRNLPGGGDTTALAFPIGDGDFNPRPLGGTALVEANVEARFPIWRQLFGAVFVDAGVLGESSLRNLTSGSRTVTPGFGVRYRSPVGPVRVDLGIRPNKAELLPVITQDSSAAGGNRLFDLTSGQSCTSDAIQPYCRLYPRDPQTGLAGIARRLVLHLSIGEAF